MKEREWRELFETSQYDDEEGERDETEVVPPEADPEQLWDEEGVVRRRARWLPVVYYVRRASSPSGSER